MVLCGSIPKGPCCLCCYSDLAGGHQSSWVGQKIVRRSNSYSQNRRAVQQAVLLGLYRGLDWGLVQRSVMQQGRNSCRSQVSKIVQTTHRRPPSYPWIESDAARRLLGLLRDIIMKGNGGLAGTRQVRGLCRCCLKAKSFQVFLKGHLARQPHSTKKVSIAHGGSVTGLSDSVWPMA